MVKTSPLPDEVLAPLPTACLHLVDVHGPHVAELRKELHAELLAKEADPWLVRNLRDEAPLAAVLEEHVRTGTPLPRLEDWQVSKRLTQGWDPHDPLLKISFLPLLRPTGHRDIGRRLFPSVRPLLEAAVAQVGTEYPWCRDAVNVPRADSGDLVPWSPPLPTLQAHALVRVVGHACIITTSALTGMRSSKLMELRVGCHAPAEEHTPGLARHRLVARSSRAAAGAARVMNGASSRRSSAPSPWPSS
ncbi:hypothetical protein ABZ516_35825 [Streptomyces sp. NPDC019826]|uniref:hypothetical protein n=1 Tax=unclassified Streptomyces TaxID=2593676 RepID=UPI0029B4C3FB|nr:hypothetical protein [Streptomyces sp. WI03-5b]MDX2623630.1 hypothetical protein [Streptomyces sp. WI03-5b]